MGGFDLDTMLQELQEQMGEKLKVDADDFFTFLKPEPNELPQLMQTLRARYGFNHLANLCSVDYGEEFELVYHLYSIPDNRKIAVKTRVRRSLAELPSIMQIYPTADWQEREVYDLMGIKFKGHTNLVRVLLPDDFVGHPLRKDLKIEG